jgi:hypothetical protein
MRRLSSVRYSVSGCQRITPRTLQCGRFLPDSWNFSSPCARETRTTVCELKIRCGGDLMTVCLVFMPLDFHATALEERHKTRSHYSFVCVTHMQGTANLV